jgi:tRNA pseudouridine55 synthase
MNGLVLIDKPSGCTSHDVVNRWRKLAQTRSVGHLGTLDPMATGLLLLLTGKATRLAQFFGRQDKTYEAEIQLGLVSDTYDREGDVHPTGRPVPEPQAAAEALLRFQGPLLQVPPLVSAKKIKGVPAYKLVRQQQPVDLPPVPVEIKFIEIKQAAGDRLNAVVRCSAGTYIRSLAHDLGAQLGCGAILTSLRRTASGSYCIADAYGLDQLEQLRADGKLHQSVLSAAKLLPELPLAYVDDLTEMHIRQGRDFRTSPFTVPAGAPLVKAISAASGELISIGEIRFPNVYHPCLVL